MKIGLHLVKSFGNLAKISWKSLESEITDAAPSETSHDDRATSAVQNVVAGSTLKVDGQYFVDEKFPGSNPTSV